MEVNESFQSQSQLSGSTVVLRCTNCNLPFDLQNLTPYLLPCDHTACKQCLRKCYKDKKDYTCQYDDKKCTLNELKSLQKNVEIINTIKERSRMNSVSLASPNSFPVKNRRELQLIRQRTRDINSPMNNTSNMKIVSPISEDGNEDNEGWSQVSQKQMSKFKKPTHAQSQVQLTTPKLGVFAPISPRFQQQIQQASENQTESGDIITKDSPKVVTKNAPIIQYQPRNSKIDEVTEEESQSMIMIKKSEISSQKLTDGEGRLSSNYNDTPITFNKQPFKKEEIKEDDQDEQASGMDSKNKLSLLVNHYGFDNNVTGQGNSPQDKKERYDQEKKVEDEIHQQVSENEFRLMTSGTHNQTKETHVPEFGDDELIKKHEQSDNQQTPIKQNYPSSDQLGDKQRIPSNKSTMLQVRQQSNQFLGSPLGNDEELPTVIVQNDVDSEQLQMMRKRDTNGQSIITDNKQSMWTATGHFGNNTPNHEFQEKKQSNTNIHNHQQSNPATQSLIELIPTQQINDIPHEDPRKSDVISHQEIIEDDYGDGQIQQIQNQQDLNKEKKQSNSEVPTIIHPNRSNQDSQIMERTASASEDQFESPFVTRVKTQPLNIESQKPNINQQRKQSVMLPLSFQNQIHKQEDQKSNASKIHGKLSSTDIKQILPPVIPAQRRASAMVPETQQLHFNPQNIKVNQQPAETTHKEPTKKISLIPDALITTVNTNDFTHTIVNGKKFKKKKTKKKKPRKSNVNASQFPIPSENPNDETEHTGYVSTVEGGFRTSHENNPYSLQSPMILDTFEKKNITAEGTTEEEPLKEQIEEVNIDENHPVKVTQPSYNQLDQALVETTDLNKMSQIQIDSQDILQMTRHGGSQDATAVNLEQQAQQQTNDEKQLQYESPQHHLSRHLSKNNNISTQDKVVQDENAMQNYLNQQIVEDDIINNNNDIRHRVTSQNIVYEELKEEGEQEIYNTQDESNQKQIYKNQGTAVFTPASQNNYSGFKSNQGLNSHLRLQQFRQQKFGSSETGTGSQIFETQSSVQVPMTSHQLSKIDQMSETTNSVGHQREILAKHREEIIQQYNKNILANKNQQNYISNKQSTSNKNSFTEVQLPPINNRNIHNQSPFNASIVGQSKIYNQTMNGPINQHEINLKTLKSEGNIANLRFNNNYLLQSEKDVMDEYEIDMHDIQDYPQTTIENSVNNRQLPHPPQNYDNQNFVSRPQSKSSQYIHYKSQLRLNESTRSIESRSQSPTDVQQIRNIMPLQDKCRLHPKETIKYFCRDATCLKGLCPDCIIEHSKHDFIAANEIAAIEVRQVIKQAQRKCKNTVRIQKDVRMATEKILATLNRERADQFQRLHQIFTDLHKELEEREQALYQMYNDEIREVESTLMQDLQIVQQQYVENVKLFKQLKTLYEQCSVSSEIAIVGNAEQAYQLNNKIMLRDQATASTNKMFYVQQEGAQQAELVLPNFHIDTIIEKSRIMKIGVLETSMLPRQNSNDNVVANDSSYNANLLNKYALQKVYTDSGLSMIPEENKSLQDSRQIISQRQSMDLGVNANIAAQLSANKSQSKNKGKDENPHIQQNRVDKQLSIQTLQRSDTFTQQSVSDIKITNLKNVHWFKWDSTEVYRLNPSTKQWFQRTDLKNKNKFLFFSSVVHLPNDQGCFILGGSDNEDNYSKRSQYFCKYNVFIEKPPMINKRAFFPSLFVRLDNSIYVMGGSDSIQTDLSACEKFSLVENVWRAISPMNISRNGTAAVAFESYRLIFVFGGNNNKVGSLSKIEKYEIDYDKWTTLELNLKVAIHDLSAISIGRDRVLIVGGHTNKEPNKDIEMIDLSYECFKTKMGKGHLTMKLGGKTYFTPSLTDNGKLQAIFGYCDDAPEIEEIDISDLITSYGMYNGLVRKDSQRAADRKHQSLEKPQYHNQLDY